MSKGLEALKVDDRLVNQDNNCVQVSSNEWKTIQKELKALDIIKEIDKTALLHLFAVCIKDKEKIDFLKEVLL